MLIDRSYSWNPRQATTYVNGRMKVVRQPFGCGLIIGGTEAVFIPNLTVLTESSQCRIIISSCWTEEIADES